MIKSFKFTSGFATAFPHLKERTFKFNDKLNVLFGNVGCGKSTMLKTMAAYCAIKTGGWSAISNPHQLAYDKPEHFPICYSGYAPGRCTADVEWDGTPSFYNDSEAMSKNDNTWFFDNAASSTDGITSSSEQLDILATKPSSGQYRIHKINKIMKIIQYVPDLSVRPSYIIDPNLFDKVQMEIDYIQSLDSTGRVTLLLDEPEKALSIPKQIQLFETLVTLTKTYNFQIIMSTHSAFILDIPQANIIDVSNGYVKEVQKSIEDLREKNTKKTKKTT